MSDHARTTQATYDEIASAFLANTRNPERSRRWIDRFVARLPVAGVVADLGSGPGRDCAQLQAAGVRAFCLDRSVGMLRAGIEPFPAERVQSDLRSLPLRSACLAGAWANASLLHLSSRELPDALGEIARVLGRSGQLHLTLKQGEGSGFETARYGRPRWFQYWSADELDIELARAGFAIVESEAEATRSAVWLIRQCELRDESLGRSRSA